MFEFKLPNDFLIGTANSAFQSEGAQDRDGKSEDIMMHYAKEYAGKLVPGKIQGKSEQKTKSQYVITEVLPDRGCFFYDNYEAYIDDMVKTGQNTFRMSISWTRIIPELDGEVNQKGIDFYNKVINKLLENNIVPMVDLMHWDLPQYLQDIGGFTSDRFIELYVKYCKVAFDAFGDRVPLWSTFNEAVCMAQNAYIGRFPPFIIDKKLRMLAMHNIILAHYQAVKLYKSLNLPGKIGCVNAMVPVYPATQSEEDIGAAERQTLFKYDWFVGPMMEGKYPQRILDECPKIVENMPPHFKEDLEENFIKMDFNGTNYYFPERTQYDPDMPLKSIYVENFYSTGDSKYTPYPAGLYDCILYVSRRYGNDTPIYITENGVGTKEKGNIDEECDDIDRINYVREHLRMCSRLCDIGVNLKGYYYWNDADSYEELTGYDHRFGMTWVDHNTGFRKWKKSREWFSKVCKTKMVD